MVKFKSIALILISFVFSSIIYASDGNDGIEHYEKLYKSGDVDAAYKLGIAHYYGISGVTSVARGTAMKYLVDAEKKGHTRAAAVLGIHYYNANDKDKALNYFRKSSTGGDLLSLAYIANLIEARDPEGAEKLYRRAIVGKSPKSFLFFGKFLIANSKPSTVKFNMGYALLLNLKISGLDKDGDVDRFLRVNPHKFGERDANILRQLMARHKI